MIVWLCRLMCRGVGHVGEVKGKHREDFSSFKYWIYIRAQAWVIYMVASRAILSIPVASITMYMAETSVLG